MDQTFEDAVAAVKAGFDRLVRAPAVCVREVPRDAPKKAVYVFYDGEQPLYVGRTNRLPSRMADHVSPHHGKAAFAFRLARDEFEQANKSARTARKKLASDADFRHMFKAKCGWVGALTVRYVEEPDPIRQTLLEVYAAMMLKTEHNSLDNH